MIQHGKMNDRVYIMKLDPVDMPDMLDAIEQLAIKKKYSKIFAKIPALCENEFVKRGYVHEAIIPSMYCGVSEGLFLAKFLSPERAIDERMQDIKSIISLSQDKTGEKMKARTGHDYSIHRATEEDVQDICAVYKEVFPSYPFPIYDPNYIRKTMTSHIQYYVIRDSSACCCGSSSAEIDEKSGCAEMTDFATLSTHRGTGLARWLLSRMEADMITQGVTMAYTIARALSAGMNITFAKNDYRFAGTLINNTNIAGSIESMNVWYKPLQAV